jgi:hypothetical protein
VLVTFRLASAATLPIFSRLSFSSWITPDMSSAFSVNLTLTVIWSAVISMLAEAPTTIGPVAP